MRLGMSISSRTKMTDDDQLVSQSLGSKAFAAKHEPFPDFLFVIRDDSKYSIPFE